MTYSDCLNERSNAGRIDPDWHSTHEYVRPVATTHPVRFPSVGLPPAGTLMGASHIPRADAPGGVTTIV